MAVIATLNTVFSATTAGFDSAVSKARKSLGGFQSAIFSVKGALAGLGVGLSLGKVVSELSEAADSMAELADAADQIGTTTEALGALRYAANFVGVESEAVTTSMSKLLNKIGEAQSGTKSAIEPFTRLGLNFRELSTLPIDQSFSKIADAIKALPSTAARTTAAMDLFGKSGAKLLPLLMQGSEGIAAASKEFEALGGSISRVDAAQVDAAAEAVEKIGTVFSGIKNQLVIGLAPFIEASAKAFTDWASSGSSASGIVMAGIEGVGKTIGVVADVVDVLHDAFQFLQAGVTVVIGGIINNFAMMGKAIQELINATGVMEVTFGDTLQAMADGVMKQAGTEWEDAKKSFAAAPPSVGINKLFEDIKANSKAAAEEVARNAQAMNDTSAQKSANAAAGWADFVKQAKGLGDFINAAGQKGAKAIADQAKSVMESTMTPLENYEKAISDLTALKTVGAIDENTFARAQAAELNKLDKATNQSASQNKNAALERGTAAAFAAEREKDSPVKTQKEILEQAKQQTTLQQQQLEAFKEGGAVPVNF